MERVRFEKWQKWLWAFGYALALALAFSLICALAACDRPAYADSEERGNGMPLDAVTYDAPAWMDGARDCKRVTDRQSGKSWWVIRVNRSLGGAYAKCDCYVVLPITEVSADADVEMVRP